MISCECLVQQKMAKMVIGNQVEEGGSLANLMICSHLPMRVPMVSLRPVFECIRVFSCSIFTFLMPSSMFISLFRKSSLATRQASSSSSPSRRPLLSLSPFQKLARSDVLFSKSSSQSLRTEAVSFCAILSSFNFFSFYWFFSFLSAKFPYSFCTSSLKRLKLFSLTYVFFLRSLISLSFLANFPFTSLTSSSPSRASFASLNFASRSIFLSASFFLSLSDSSMACFFSSASTSLLRMASFFSSSIYLTLQLRSNSSLSVFFTLSFNSPFSSTSRMQLGSALNNPSASSSFFWLAVSFMLLISKCLSLKVLTSPSIFSEISLSKALVLVLTLRSSHS